MNLMRNGRQASERIRKVEAIVIAIVNWVRRIVLSGFFRWKMAN